MLIERVQCEFPSDCIECLFELFDPPSPLYATPLIK